MKTQKAWHICLPRIPQIHIRCKMNGDLCFLIITTISTWAREMEKIFAQNFLLKCQFSQQMNFARLDAVEIAFLVIEEREYADT